MVDGLDLLMKWDYKDLWEVERCFLGRKMHKNGASEFRIKRTSKNENKMKII